MRPCEPNHAAAPEEHDQRRQETSNELLGRLEELVQENRRLADLYWAAEKRHGALLSLYVAALRLHSTLDRNEQLLALQEVLANLVGCEEAAVYEMQAGELKPIALFPAASSPVEVPLDQGPIARALEARSVYIAPQPVPLGGITACAPLLLDGDPAGAIVLFRLLHQKLSLDDHDRELLEMLSTHAAIALNATATRPHRV
jgi:hypothetical protein